MIPVYNVLIQNIYRFMKMQKVIDYSTNMEYIIIIIALFNNKGT
jgi:hypothetical protein